MKKNILIVGVLVVAVAAVVGIKNKKNTVQEPAGCEGGVCALPVPIEQTAKDTKQPLPKLLDLGAGKCVPCKMMEPILDELTESFAGKLDIEFIDVWENQPAGQDYGIRMIPTQIFYDAEGNELFRHEGFFSREDILAKWQELGYAFGEPQNIEQGMSNIEEAH
jgi:thioredoxin 1